MLNRRSWPLLAMGAVGLTGVAISLIAGPGLPDPMPIHWNAEGIADGFAPKSFALWMMPVFATVFPLGLTLVGRRVKEPTQTLFRWTLAATAAFLVGVHGLMIHSALSASMTMSVGAIMALIGGLTLAISLMLPHTEPNRVMGFRTKATINDPVLWKLVHSFGAKVMGAASIGTILCGIFLDGTAAFGAGLTLILGGSLLPMVYAWMLARVRNR